MNWVDRLLSSDRKLTLGTSQITGSQLGKMAGQKSCSMPLFWQADWTPDAWASFFAALDSGFTIVVMNNPNEERPDLTGKEKGWIVLRSSGTEGPSRWIFHRQETLSKLVPLYQNMKAAAVLKPGHAAGIEYLLTGLLGNNELTCLSEARELRPGIDLLHGPPTLLAWLLNFSTEYHELLKNLKKYYNGTDSLHPAIVGKLATTAYSFNIEQIYGTTESWRVPTVTNAERPWQLRFIGNSVSLIGNKISISSELVSPSVSTPFCPGDRWIEDEKGWGHIENDRHWVANFHGTKLNLFDIEEKLLTSPAISDVELKIQKNFLGESLQVTLFAGDEKAALEHAGKILDKNHAKIFVKGLDAPSPGKRRRK